MATWEQRRIGRTNLHVTSLGLGTATMGGSRIPMSNEERLKLVEAAWNAGVRYVDTAPFYGVGAAERAAGDALRDKPRDAWVLSTKVGRLLRPRSGGGGATDGRLAPMPFEVQYDYSYDGIMRSIEDSYQRLGLAKIDILLVHDIGVYQHGEEANAAHMKSLRESGYRALEELRRTGVVNAIGLGVNEKAVLIEVLGWGEWDAFLLAGRYTLLEQDSLDTFLPLCEKRNAAVVVGGGLNEELPIRESGTSPLPLNLSTSWAESRTAVTEPAKVVSVPFRSASETPSPTTSPSTCVNIGVCVRSN